MGTTKGISEKDVVINYRGYEFLVRRSEDKKFPWEFIYRKMGTSKSLFDPDAYATRKSCIQSAKEQIDRDIKFQKIS